MVRFHLLVLAKKIKPMTRLTFKKDGKFLKTLPFTIPNATVSAVLDTENLSASILLINENINTLHLKAKNLNDLKKSVKTSLKAYGVNFEEEVRVRLPNAKSE